MRTILITILIIFATQVGAEPRQYGSFIYNSEFKNAVFLMDEIDEADSFELRKALRNHPIDTLVLASPGGNVSEALSMAGLIFDQGLRVYIPEGSKCASACSFLFFAGKERLVAGELGVDQFVSADALKKEEIGKTQATSQFIVSEIIGYLNEFKTPRFVLERMFEDPKMYWFNQTEKNSLNSAVFNLDQNAKLLLASAITETSKKRELNAKENAKVIGLPLKLSALASRDLADKIKRCWIIPSSTGIESLRLTVSVAFDKHGKIASDDILLRLKETGTETESQTSIRRAFGAAKRAIQRCGANGFQALRSIGPSQIEITFDHSVQEVLIGDAKKNRFEFEPLPFVLPILVAEDTGGRNYNEKLSRLIAQDLTTTGLFREIPSQAYISSITSFSSPIQFSDWKAINAQALVVGAVSASASGELVVKFRVYDVFSNAELGSGLKFSGTVDAWRRMGHKVADVIYTRLTGESGYFDSRILFVSENGPKGDRKKRLAIMDQDGANVQFLTDGSDLVLAPRFSPAGERVLYTSYETGFPQIYMLDVGTVSKRSLRNDEETMSFSPSFSPDGASVVFSAQSRKSFSFMHTDRSGAKYRKHVQFLLNERNCGAGIEDGVAGRKTLQAAARFSQSVGINFYGDIYAKEFFYELTKSSKGCDGKQLKPQSSFKGSDIYVLNLNTGNTKRLTSTISNDMNPSFSPDGAMVIFASDKSGSSQLYTMSATGLDVRRISFGNGSYSMPAWSPRGDMIAFSKTYRGRHHIGVMRVDGSAERLLTASYLDERPTWSPNGRVIAFTRETQGPNGSARLYTIDISGRNLRVVPTPDGASDAAWSPLGR